ncbi:site-specific integrase [Belliella sp. R4-6]|uniref:Site-specific integrase n=1 Tax=Belliella alkalica TaxID=1730871 RepID=A0ABS9V622_9BACT|nr:site-specific integrase [Belliella alkalica]MCH7411875.1 site-specific integrase [Belliella alkalica]
MKITLKKKKLKNGDLSLYIEYYKGSTTDENGKRTHLRDFEFLKLILHGSPSSAGERKENKENLQLAENVLSIRKSDYIQGKFEVKNMSKLKRPFLDYFKEKMEEKSNSEKNYGVWTSTFAHLKNCVSPGLIFEEVDDIFTKKVRLYFEQVAYTKSDLPLSLNSKYSYFNKFKACLRSAFEEGYLNINYAGRVKSFEQAESQREYLTFSELQSLTITPCKYKVLKRAFLFSCLTGLRWSDVNSLTWSKVRDEDNNIFRVNFRQKKTAAMEYLYISKQARDLLGERQLPQERVFLGLKYGAVFNNEIVRWCNRAGISKHITFHSARHTNAVLLLENGADLFTVQKRLGHKEIRTTAIYAKIVDEKMKESANIIPVLNVEF